MKYSEVETELHRQVSISSTQCQRAFAIDAIDWIARLDDLKEVVQDELDADAAIAFWHAIQAPGSLTAQSIAKALNQIDDGDLTDGELDSTLLWALTVLESWGKFLGSQDEAPIVAIAITLLEIIDFEIDGADLDDFLADPRISQQFNAIVDRLSGASAPTPFAL